LHTFQYAESLNHSLRQYYPKMLEENIVNVVATASIDRNVDFEKLRKCEEILYNPGVYGGRVAYFKSSDMQGKVSIFSTGKMISVGTRSTVQAFKELEKAKQLLIKIKIVGRITLKPKVRNIVISINFGKAIDLEVFSEKSRAIYEPEQFPGAILTLKEPFKAKALVFASGKAVILGLVNQTQITPTVEHIALLLKLTGTLCD
jgi:TATA-box binding protein (TBP) (component of TFIID and TFIIIB)